MTPTEKAAHEAAEELLQNKWSVTHSNDDAGFAKEIILRHLAPIQAELDELAKIRAILKEPGLVWANMLRGTIARPQALDHYEECKARVEALEAELDSRREESAKLEKLVEKLSKAAPGCKGAPDPIDHGFVCLDYLQAELARKDAENKALRQIVSDSVKAIGNGSGCSTESSLEFMQHVPKEISLVLDRKDKLMEEAKDLITRATTIDSVSEGYRHKQQDWLART